MPGRIREHALFFREYVRHFHATGAIAPSGRFLAAALTRYVAQPAGAGRRILEVGPGTGAVTRRIVRALGPEDRLDLVELNERFVAGLRDCLKHDPEYRAVADRTRVIHAAVEELDAEAGYDAAVSGLPLNNFSGELVGRILAQLMALLRPGGTLAFFEYVAIRRARAVVSGRHERTRLREIGQAMDEAFAKHEFHRERVWLNLPPAWVHHLRA
jgi:phosphatidylethanolamine/phosphatidyl-N-methylethanolamine N-methyltransferase